MTVQDISTALDLTPIAGAVGLTREVEGCYVSDLLSDVMGNAEMNQVWITLQTHKNVMAIASLKELAGVVIVNGQAVPDETLAQANNEQIPILRTSMPTFEVAGRLYALLHS